MNILPLANQSGRFQRVGKCWVNNPWEECEKLVHKLAVIPRENCRLNHKTVLIIKKDSFWETGSKKIKSKCTEEQNGGSNLHIKCRPIHIPLLFVYLFSNF